MSLARVTALGRPAARCCAAVRVAPAAAWQGATRSVSVRVRSQTPQGFRKAQETFNRRVQNEGIERTIQKNRFHMKRKTKRLLNKEATKYYKARKEVVGDYMEMVRRGQIVTLDSGF